MLSMVGAVGCGAISGVGRTVWIEGGGARQGGDDGGVLNSARFVGGLE